MNAGNLCGFDNLCRIYLTEAGYVLGDGALEEFDVLRQITEMWAYGSTIQMEHVCPIQAHLSALSRPDSEECACESRFTGSARP